MGFCQAHKRSYYTSKLGHICLHLPIYTHSAMQKRENSPALILLDQTKKIQQSIQAKSHLFKQMCLYGVHTAEAGFKTEKKHTHTFQ